MLRSGARVGSLESEEERDAHLMALAARGDTDALAQLYDRHVAVMLALARHLLRGKGEPEDLVHDVFLEAWRHSAEYDRTRGSVRAWLVLRTRSRAIDLLRSARVARSVGDPGGVLGDAASSRGLEDPEFGPDRAALREAVAALPEDQRKVLLLGYYRGLSSSEIAAEIGVPVGTVKSRVLAALTKLRGSYLGAMRGGGR